MTRITAKMHDGTPVVIDFKDLGKVGDVYRTHFTSDKFHILSQISAREVDDSCDSIRVRGDHDIALLKAAGVDVSTIDFADC